MKPSNDIIHTRVQTGGAGVGGEGVEEEGGGDTINRTCLNEQCDVRETENRRDDVVRWWWWVDGGGGEVGGREEEETILPSPTCG